MDQETGTARPGPPEFFENHHVEEIVQPQSSVDLGNGAAQKPLCAGLEPKLARHDAVFFPFGVKRHDLPVDEASNRPPKNVVFFPE